MNTTRQNITVRQLFNGYQDHDWEGVVGFGGKLDIRPKYQREFIYDDERQRKVIDTVRHERPLNIMYWVVNGDHFELLDGQQRTLLYVVTSTTSLPSQIKMARRCISTHCQKMSENKS